MGWKTSEQGQRQQKEVADLKLPNPSWQTDIHTHAWAEDLFNVVYKDKILYICEWWEHDCWLILPHDLKRVFWTSVFDYAFKQLFTFHPFVCIQSSLFWILRSFPAITLATTINILWDFHLGSELKSEREAEIEERLFKASATWDSDVQGEQNTLERKLMKGCSIYCIF